MAAAAAATSKNITTGRFLPQFQLVNAYAPRNSNYCAVQLYRLRNSPFWPCDTTNTNANHEQTEAKHQQREAPFQWIRLPFLPNRYLKQPHYSEHIRSVFRCAFLPDSLRFTQADPHRSDSVAPNKTAASSSPDNPLFKINTNKPASIALPPSPPPTPRFQTVCKTVDKDKSVSNMSTTTNDNINNDNNNKDNNKNKNNNDVVIGTFRNPSGKTLELLRSFHNHSDDTPRYGAQDVYFAGFRNPPDELLTKLKRLFPELPDPSPCSLPTTSLDPPPQDSNLATNSSNQPNWAGQKPSKAAPLANSATPIIQREQPHFATPHTSIHQELRHQDTFFADQDEDGLHESAPFFTLHDDIPPLVDCSIRQLKARWEKQWCEEIQNQSMAFIYSLTHPAFQLQDFDACSIASSTRSTHRSSIGLKPTTEKRHHPHARRKPTRKHSQHNPHLRPLKITSRKKPVREPSIRRPHFLSTPPSTTTSRRKIPVEYSLSPSSAPVPIRFDGYAPNPRPSIWNKPVSYKHEPPDTIATGIREL